jgi:hypothetical protein
MFVNVPWTSGDSSAFSAYNKVITTHTDLTNYAGNSSQTTAIIVASTLTVNSNTSIYEKNLDLNNAIVDGNSKLSFARASVYGGVLKNASFGEFVTAYNSKLISSAASFGGSYNTFEDCEITYTPSGTSGFSGDGNSATFKRCKISIRLTGSTAKFTIFGNGDTVQDCDVTAYVPSGVSCSVSPGAYLSGTKVTIVKGTTGTTTYYN